MKINLAYQDKYDLDRVATVRKKSGKEFFSRSGKSQGISILGKVRKNDKSQGKVREFEF